MKVHASLLLIQSRLKAPKNQVNTFGKYKYRSCEDILEAVKPLLEAGNSILTINDEIINVGDRFYIKATATLTNVEDGTFIQNSAFAREEETKKGMDGSQVTGASSSYARKYALNGLFGIDDTKDSDSTNTHGNDTPKTETSKAKITEPIKAENQTPPPQGSKTPQNAPFVSQRQAIANMCKQLKLEQASIPKLIFELFGKQLKADDLSTEQFEQLKLAMRTRVQ